MGRADWAIAREILYEVFEGRDAKVHVGRVHFLGDGLFRRAFRATVKIEPDPDERSAAYVVLLPRWNVDADFDRRVRREARLLTRLGEKELPFRIPRIAGVVSERGHPVLVESIVPGLELDLRADRQGLEKPWEVVGELAAAVHELDPALVEVGHATRRAHAQAKLSSFEGLEDTLVLDAQAWAHDHLPPATESVFLHGDLLGQNIMLHPEEPFGIIDWEFATRGDPAEELAIVTRGVRRPFQKEETGSIVFSMLMLVQAGRTSPRPRFIFTSFAS